MVIMSLVIPSLLLMIFYSIFLYIIRKWFASRVRIFFWSLFIAVVVLSLFYLLGNEPVFTYFCLGVMACILGLWKFQALPYMPGWTLPEAKIKLRDIPLHHSFFGIILFIVIVTFDALFVIQYPFTLLIAFMYGGAIFAITSQIPEIFEHRTLFWKKSVT